VRTTSKEKTPMAYAGEIRLFAGDFAPESWAFCDGQPLLIEENYLLWSMIGTTYGGDGVQNFNLPNLRGRVPMHMGVSPSGTPRQLGEQLGSTEVALTQQTMPSHSHPLAASTVPALQQVPTGVLATAHSVQPGTLMYGTNNVVAMNTAAMAPTTGDHPHQNCQPFLCLNFIIALTNEGDSEPYLGEVRVFATPTPPSGWAQCNGQLLPREYPYTGLFSLLGTSFGGDGKVSFALPNLQGRVPLHVGDSNFDYLVGEASGVQQVSLELSQMPSHTHVLQASDANATAADPLGQLMARGVWKTGTASGDVGAYSSLPPATPMAIEAVGVTGSYEPHENMQPYLTLNYCIAMVGVFPPRGSAPAANS
jgi:microcystin-dependent protein